jgi:hypothetical protein
VDAIGNGAVVVERGEHAAHRVQHVVDAADVEVGLLLAGERGVGQVLGGGRGAHGEARFAALRHARVFLADLALELRGQRRLLDPAADLAPGACELGHVLDVDLRQGLGDALREVAVGEEVVECLGGGGEAAGHAYTGGGQLADQLAERRVLAADAGHVGHSHGFEAQDVRVRRHGVVFLGGGRVGSLQL